MDKMIEKREKKKHLNHPTKHMTCWLWLSPYQNCRPHLHLTGLASGYWTLTTWWQSGAGHHFNSRLHWDKKTERSIDSEDSLNQSFLVCVYVKLSRFLWRVGILWKEPRSMGSEQWGGWTKYEKCFMKHFFWSDVEAQFPLSWCL